MKKFLKIFGGVCSGAILSTALVATSCTVANFTQDQTKTFKIEGDSTLDVGETVKYVLKLNDSIVNNNRIEWKVIKGNAQISSDGTLKAQESGDIEIVAQIDNSSQFVANKQIHVLKNDEPEPERVSISGRDFIYVGGMNRYTFNVYPAEASTQGFTWSLDGTYGDARISSDGILVVDALYPPITIICQNEDGSICAKKRIDVYLNPIEEQFLEIEGPTHISVGSTYAYNAYGWVGYERNLIPCAWTLQDKEHQAEYVHVDRDGYLTPLKPGEIDLVAIAWTTTQSVANLHIVIGEPIKPTNMNLYTPSEEHKVSPNKPLSVYCNIEPESADPQIEWSLDNKNFNLITDPDKPKWIKIESIGTDFGKQITLTAKSKLFNDVFATMTIWTELDDIRVEGPEIALLGETQQYRVVSEQHHEFITSFWSVSDETKATISQDGVLTPLSCGDIEVIAHLEYGDEYSIAVRIVKAPTEINIIGSNYIDLDRETFEIYAIEMEPSDAAKDVEWEVSPSNIATFNPITKHLVPSRSGKVQLTARSIYNHSISDTLDITIHFSPSFLWLDGPDGIKLNDQDVQYKIQTYPVGATSDVDWYSSDGSVATVDDKGNVHGLSEGHTTIICVSKDNPAISCQKQIIVYDDQQTTSVICSELVGSGMKFKGEAWAASTKDYECDFVSSTYPKDSKSSEPLPVHKELKKTDIEVLINGENIINNNDVTLKHNHLTIPTKYFVSGQPYIINILGAEIADWVTWRTISDISDEDLLNDTEVCKDIFSVGDYKKIYSEGNVLTTARIIDFFHDTFIYTDERGILTPRLAPFTFQLTELISDSCWGKVDGDYPEQASYKFGQLDLVGETILKIQKNMESLDWDDKSPDPLEKSILRGVCKYRTGTLDPEGEIEYVDTYNVTLFPLAYTELTGEELPPLPNFSQQTIPAETADDQQYAYYNEEKYKCSKTEKQRRTFTKAGSTKAYGYYLRNICITWYDEPAERIDSNYTVNSNGSFVWESCLNCDTLSYPFCPAFCI